MSRPSSLLLSVSLFVATSIFFCPLQLRARSTKKSARDSQSSKAKREKPSKTVEETIVVTASRNKQNLHEAPVAVTVMDARDLKKIPAHNFGDVLRNVPGLNVSQMSARDIEVTGRTASSDLASSELVLLDNRSLYLDFFGFVMWDYVPVNPNEIERVEVVRGPGSAVWGANAMSGVINLITKSPKQMVGTDVMVGGGGLGTAYANVDHAAVFGKLGYRVSGGYYRQDPYPRPTGLIPGTSTAYPPFKNQGTKQPRVDLRVDYDQSDSTTWSYSAGYSGTSGIMHSGIGPFSIDSSSHLSYVKADWMHRAAHVEVFGNFLNGSADNLLTRGIDGRPLHFAFDSKTYDIDLSNTTVLRGRHILTYGANARRDNFDLSIARLGGSRQQYGAFIQDEMHLSPDLTWVLGTRFDNIDPIGSVVSPRTSLLFSPTPESTFHISFSRAFTAPSLVEDYLDINIVNQIDLPTGPYSFPTRVLGNENLKEQRLDAYEIGYVGTFANGLTFTAAAYRNVSKDSSNFFPNSFYSAQNPPPGWPLPVQYLEFAPLDQLPAGYTYRNIGKFVDKGVELSLNKRSAGPWSWFVNYSFQDTPEVRGIPADEVNIPPTSRANLGLSYDGRTFFANTNVNYQGKAVWRDVLDSRYWGPTDPFTQVNLSFGVHLFDGKATASVIAQNLFNARVQQHVFGDIISRRVTAQLSFHM